jgi:hypothetical protein
MNTAVRGIALMLLGGSRPAPARAQITTGALRAP